MITSGLPRDLASLGIATGLIPTRLGETRISLVIIIIIIIKTLLVVSGIRVVKGTLIESSVVPVLLFPVPVSISHFVLGLSCLIRVQGAIRPRREL